MIYLPDSNIFNCLSFRSKNSSFYFEILHLILTLQQYNVDMERNHESTK